MKARSITCCDRNHNQECLILPPSSAYRVVIGSDLVSTTLAAITAFSATNVDDIVLLMLLFSRLDQQFRAFHVVSGQFLGIATLVLFSLVGFGGRSFLPETWLGLLGLLHICLGCSQLLQRFDTSVEEAPEASNPSFPLIGLAGIIGVASLTIANGSDNIGVYLPLFASNSPAELLITLAVFAVLTALWCLVAWLLSRAPGLASLLQRYGDALLPPVLIAVGGMILRQCGTLQDPMLALLVLGCLAVMVLTLVRQLQALLKPCLLAGASQR